MIGRVGVDSALRIHVQPSPRTKQFERKQGANAEALERDPAAPLGPDGEHEYLALTRLQVLDVALHVVDIESNALARAFRAVGDRDTELR